MSSRRATTGRPVLFAVEEIVAANHDISTIELIEPRPVPLLQERYRLTPAQEALVDRGLQLRKDSGLPFWDSVLVSCFFSAGQSVAPLLAQAQFHNDHPLGQATLPASECTAERLEELCRSSRLAGRTLALRSCVRLRNGATAHIPMIDFHCPADQNKDLACAAIEVLRAGRGYLVESGKSYHYYGATLLPDSDLSRFLGEALLLSPLVDRAWIAHQLVEGACALRLSTRDDQDVGPLIVAEIPG